MPLTFETVSVPVILGGCILHSERCMAGLRPRVVPAASPTLRETLPRPSTHFTPVWHGVREDGMSRLEKTQVWLEHAVWIGKLETGDESPEAERRKSNRIRELPRMSGACSLPDRQCNGRHLRRLGLTFATMNLPVSPMARKSHSRDRESGRRKARFRG